jgi:hypothetical protein
LAALTAVCKPLPIGTVVARVSLNMLRSRKVRSEEPLGVHMPDPIVDRADGIDPEHEALLADSVGLALLVVLETQSVQAARVRAARHFALPFDEIAPIVDRSPEAARQLASRARRRVQGENTFPTPPWKLSAKSSTRFSRPRATATSRRCSRCWTPNVVLRADFGPLPAGGSREVRGARAVAGQALFYSRLGLDLQPALINGAAGAVSTRDGEPFSVGPSRSGAGRSSRSTSSPTRSGSASST